MPGRSRSCGAGAGPARRKCPRRPFAPSAPQQVGREFYPGALSQIVEQPPGVRGRELEDRVAFPTVQPELEDRHGLLAADEERRTLPVPALAGEVHQTLLPAHVLDADRTRTRPGAGPVRPAPFRVHLSSLAICFPRASSRACRVKNKSGRGITRSFPGVRLVSNHRLQIFTGKSALKSPPRRHNICGILATGAL